MSKPVNGVLYYPEQMRFAFLFESMASGEEEREIPETQDDLVGQRSDKMPQKRKSYR